MKNFRCYVVMPLLLGMISGCGSIMSSAQAGGQGSPVVQNAHVG